MRALALLLALAAGPAAADCRQALVLGLDVSRSVDRREHALQTGGLARALEDAEVRAAFLADPGAPVEFAVFDWSGAGEQRLLLPWTRVTGAGVLDRAAAALRQIGRPEGSGMTAVGSALMFGAALLAERPGCARRTLDLSGDGVSNSGPPPQWIELGAAGREITVNGLAIGRPGAGRVALDPDLGALSAWYGAAVIRGPGAFVQEAVGFEDFARAIRRKLLRELQPPVAAGEAPDRKG